MCGLSALLAGCPKAPEYPKAGAPSTAPQEPKETVVALEEFDPPSLDELNSQVEWEDQPVLDGLELLQKELADSPAPVSAQEALKLRNTSDEANEKILLTLGRPSESGDPVDDTAELKRHIAADISTVNPIMQSTMYDVDVVGLTGIGFFTFDWRMEPFAPAEYVKSWQTSKDKLYDKVVIRNDLKWSDGKPITAHDVVFSFQTIMNPDVPVPAVRTGMDKVRWVEAYDDQTFVIFHKESLATNVWNCNFPILPKHVFADTIQDDPTLMNSPPHQKFEQNPVCGGPYKLIKRVKGQEVILERREDWYMHQGKQVRPKPNFKRIRFRVIEDSNTARLALNEGQVEDLELQPMQWVEQTNDDAFYAKNTKVRGPQWVYYYFGWNQSTPYFSDARVRTAMSHAVNYDQILKTLCYGLYPPCTGELHPDSWAGPVEPRQPYKQDLGRAEALLTEAGWKDTDGDGIRDKEINGRKVKFEFGIMCSNEQLRVDICTSLAESLNRLGIVCNVQPTEFTVLQQRAQDHKFQAMFGGWGTGTDPSTTENLWKTGENRNYTNYSNARVDELFDKAKYELEQEERAKYYRQIDDILWDEQPYTWLYYRSAFYGFNKRLRGYKFSPRGPYHYSPGFDAIWAVK